MPLQNLRNITSKASRLETLGRPVFFIGSSNAIIGSAIGYKKLTIDKNYLFVILLPPICI